MIGVIQAIVGWLTFVVLFFALPAWFFWFHNKVAIYFPDYAQKKAQTLMAVGAVWLAVTLWLLWRYVLPDWWIAATPMLTNE